jgi:glyoxylase-like metal-dependent hydrolase (beta-lactamase superfamily II)
MKPWKSALASLLETEGCKVSACLLTHHHADHIGGAGDVADICNPTFHKMPSDTEDSAMSWPESAGALQPLRNGQEFKTEGATIRVVATPGHTLDSVTFVASGDVVGGSDEDERLARTGTAAFVGDCVLGKGTSVISDFAMFETSLQSLISIKPDVLYCGHGPEIGGQAPDSRFRALATLEDLLSHRRSRIEQIVGVLSSEAARNDGLSARQVAEKVYRDAGMLHVFDIPALVRAAAHQTLVSLRYLEQRGRVARGSRLTSAAAKPESAAAPELAAMQEGGVHAQDLNEAADQLWELPRGSTRE